MNERDHIAAVTTLCDAEPRFAVIVERAGVPPFWTRPPSFASMVLLVLEQLVSLESARAIYSRLARELPSMTPVGAIDAGEEAFRAAGVTRAKTRCCLEVARRILAGELNLDMDPRIDDAVAQAALEAVPGIGPWTSGVWLVMAGCRPDVWPRGDRALVLALREVFELDDDPTPAKARRMADVWSPHRSTAARLLWHHYLSVRDRRVGHVDGLDT